MSPPYRRCRRYVSDSFGRPVAWNFDSAEQNMQMINFTKNLALMGGLALLVAHGPGRYSIDARLRRPFEA